MGREGDVMSAAREFDGTFNVQPQVYGTYASEQQYDRDMDDPQHQDMYMHGEGPPRGTRYGKFDHDPYEEATESRDAYRRYPPREGGAREGEHWYPRPTTRPPPESREGYSRPTFPPYSGGRVREEEEWRRGQLSPPRAPPRDFPRARPPYGEPEPPIPPAVRARPPIINPDDYRGALAAHDDPYYHRPPPPPEPKRSGGIFSQMESIDYSHGGGGGGGGGGSVKSVDYNHGSTASQGYHPPVVHTMPPGGANFQYSEGYTGVYGEGAVQGSYMQFGSPATGTGGGGGGYMGGLDPAAIFAAYQGGNTDTTYKYVHYKCVLQVFGLNPQLLVFLEASTELLVYTCT